MMFSTFIAYIKASAAICTHWDQRRLCPSCRSEVTAMQPGKGRPKRAAEEGSPGVGEVGGARSILGQQWRASTWPRLSFICRATPSSRLGATSSCSTRRVRSAEGLWLSTHRWLSSRWRPTAGDTLVQILIHSIMQKKTREYRICPTQVRGTHSAEAR